MESARAARSNAEDAYQAIRKLIVTVEMPPGSPFTEGELVKRVGLGKTPVREALLRLKLENLIAVQPRSGYRVAPVTLKDVRDTCRFLSYLELQAAEQATNDAAASIARLRPLQDQVEQDRSSEEPARATEASIRADWHFHLGLARGHENQLQVEAMTRLNQHILRFRYLAVALGRSGLTLAHEHGELLGAVAKGDSAGAVAATAKIWRETEAELVAILAATDSVQTTNVWGGSDKNAFYLDAETPGPSVDDVFESSLRMKATSEPRADG
jgi:DNA-binding GntR family transcriptional regulator